MTSPAAQRIGWLIVGRGRVGRGLSSALEPSGARARLTPGRSPDLDAVARAEAVIVATPDPAVTAVASAIASRLTSSVAVLHCSGTLGVDALEPCRAAGAAVGAMHPLASFADPDRPPTLSGASFVIDGDPAAVRVAEAIAAALGARPVLAAVHGPAYHAAAALSANGAAALATVAVRVLQRVGLSGPDATRAIGALLRTVGENVERVGVPAALSGPVIRGDVQTVARHREALEALDPPARRAYDAIAPAILDCARRAGLPEPKARALEALLSSGAIAEPDPGSGSEPS